MLAAFYVVDSNETGITGRCEECASRGKGDCPDGRCQSWTIALEMNRQQQRRTNEGEPAIALREVSPLPESEYAILPASLLNTNTAPLSCPLAVNLPSWLRSTAIAKLPSPVLLPVSYVWMRSRLEISQTWIQPSWVVQAR